MLGIIVIIAIGNSAVKTYKTTRRAYAQVSPYLNDLKSRAQKAVEKSTEFGERLERLAEVYEELGGRWTFISENFQETSKSPLVKMAEFAGKISSKQKGD